MMGNDYFEDILKRMYQNTCDSYNQLGSSSNQTIGDIIKSLTEQSDKYYEELDQNEKENTNQNLQMKNLIRPVKN